MLGLLEENERNGRGLPRFGFCKRGGCPLLLAVEGKKKIKPAGREERKMMSFSGLSLAKQKREGTALV